MAGIDDNVAVIGDWAPPEPSPRTFFSTILGDDFGSRPFSELLEHNGNGGSLPNSSQGTHAGADQKDMASSEDKNGTGVDASTHLLSEPSLFSIQKSSSRGGLAERMAARAGFSAPKLNTEKIRSANLSSSPEIQSPYITIPPGLSPTTLLDSPVFLSNSLAQPSPTTGKFSFASSSNSRSSLSISEAPERSKDGTFEDVDTSSFEFKPHLKSSSLFFADANKVTSVSNLQQSFPRIEVSVQSGKSLMSQNAEQTDVLSQNQNGFNQPEFPKASIGRDREGKNIVPDPVVFDTVAGNAECSPPLEEQHDGEEEKREVNSIGGAPSEDGYNWRKYGQKQVKGSEFPRSYYKCTHPHCQVKKKVERSPEGHITEIIYKGAHNHPKPPPNRRSAIGSSNLSDMHLDIPEQAGLQDGAVGDAAWASSQPVSIIGGPEWRCDNLEVTSAMSPDFCDPSNSQAQNGLHLESGDAVDVSSTLSNDEDEDDRGTHGSMSLGYDGEGDESESKRRRIDASVLEMNGASRAIREPRVVVQTTSEVDILDDGYRWRKYGQKVVKGNPNPRSYYKCTNAGCTVRKHVERAAHDLKSVITTYEGKHNHDVPAARNSNHVSSSNSITAPLPTSQTQVHRPEPSQIHNSMARFEGPASISSFSLPGRQQVGPSTGFTFAMTQPGLANLAMAGLGPSERKLPVLPVHPYLGQQRQLSEMGFMIPKGEPKEETMPEPGLNLSNGSSVYHQIMNRLPLGPPL
ncbi:PREDICTED: probable WRKY transcription factor 2 [Nelumbo nucifera]|uniref:WRKY domain-containing protein n=2 Tax=Nelumbo nucifera TaxID=4432 RepID=A0A822XYA7_NELNU|nr:PREDICTED: probable WRKY transcription factor 2 [Nelumbo nucifera]XP_010252877.1 PREDICTED: probable WRKY transcription factor 2 [Nelumbo nucifera]DAD23745.1 TPA_asm: hypothetical protein HUJ06_025208 [Nelumbo nucifera]